MNNKLVTLIGGGGFLGRYAAQALLKAGARVRIAQRDPRQAYFLKPLAGLGQTQFVGADMARPDTIRRAIEGADLVVNLVGTFAAGQMQRLHVDGPGALARHASEIGVGGLVHISAIGADPAAAAQYGRTKGEGEAAVRAGYPAATILRPSTVFGREDRFLNMFAQMIEAIAALPIVKVVPVLRGGAKFQPVYVADVAEAIAAILADPGATAGRTLELGGPDVVTMIGLQRWIAEAIGRTPGFLELPDALGAIIARLPGTPISTDQWLMLQCDTVVTGENGLATLGITPTAMAAVAPAWLVRFHKAGRFGARAALEA